MASGRAFHIGSTSNLTSRLEYHNSGKQRYTRNRTPFSIVYSEEFPEKSQALKREKQIKAF
ncbi:MAG TPA: GIY-YIG nuclease family protein [Bacteroidetes bacterium]|nr:GIY-YIG nuclease family protein [Bacteroidota bacterium]